MPSNSLRPLARGAAGRLEIAYTGAFLDPVLFRVMRLFRQRFPVVEFGLRELHSYQQVHELMDSGLGSVPPNRLVYCMRLLPAASKSRRNPSPGSAEKA